MYNMTSNISIEIISQLPNLNANNLEYKYFIKTESLKQNQLWSRVWFSNPSWCIVIYRVIQEESARLREMIVCVILSKKVHMNMGPILNGYGVMTVWDLEKKVMIIDNKRNKIINQHNTWYI